MVRVLARLRAIGGDPTSKEAVQRWAALAGVLVDPERPGDFNQVPTMLLLQTEPCADSELLQNLP